MAEQCAMIIGYLVPHRCEHLALGSCIQCGRSYCEEHVSVTQNGLVCQACSQGLEQPVALPMTAQSFSLADLAAFEAASRWDESAEDAFSDLS
jgi:recombinational DNA repair protein (RecF pathway)